MKLLSRAVVPTDNRRLNELIGFLLLVCAVLLLLALVSYSPLDPSLNTAAAGHGVHNWIGVVGAWIVDLILQGMGISAILLPLLLGLLAARWFRSRKVGSANAKAIGGILLLLFVPALIAIQPLRLRWMHAIPIEGLTGRILGDLLIRFFATTGAYIVACAVIAVALYLSTAFSFSSLELWLHTRFAFAFAAMERFRDWRERRRQARAQRKLEKRRVE